MKIHSKNIAILSINLALIITLQLFAELLKSFGMVMSLALGIIPVLVLAQTRGIKLGMISGAFFGIVSLVLAVIGSSAMPMYKIAINPLVSVFPRIMVGLVTGAVFSRLSKKTNSKKSQYIHSIVATACGIATNTLLFLGMFLLFAYNKTFDTLTINFKWLLSTVVALNTVIELLVFTFLVPPIVRAFKINAV